jgi:hypothetical protein
MRCGPVPTMLVKPDLSVFATAESFLELDSATVDGLDSSRQFLFTGYVRARSDVPLLEACPRMREWICDRTEPERCN